jgi:hypothetical protein
MLDYTTVCGLAFEDLTADEMLDYEGGVTPATAALSYFVVTAIGGGAVSLTITYIWR